jgi:cyclopropane-fatty-acyl-phospholipid synthase
VIEKRIFHQLLLKIRHGAVTVRYWDGSVVTYGTGKPYFTLIVKEPAAIRAMLRGMSLGFGESYMNGLLDIEGDLTKVGQLVSENAGAFKGLSRTNITALRNFNRRDTQQQQIQHHYDLGNNFYKLWLDKSMAYSCAYFKTPADSLEKAQVQKIDHVLRKLQLEKGQRLLDIGSGWGALLIRAAQEYGVTGLGITLSREQLEHATEAAKKAGVDKQIRFELLNYQDLAEQGELFDRVVSVGMFEHVGRRNQAAYFQAVDKLLKPGGISVLHTITNEHDTASDPWIDRYIFPGGYIPSIHSVVNQMPNRNFRLVDYENLRIHYAMTLNEWWRRFEQYKDKVIKMYDERFYKMWRLYLASSASGFRYGELSLSQFVFTKGINNNLPLTREFLYGGGSSARSHKDKGRSPKSA